MADLSHVDHLREDVTIAQCARCDRSGELTTVDGAWWCAWCGGPATIVFRRARMLREEVADAHTTGGQLVDPEAAPLQPLRVTQGWQVAYNNGLYAVRATPDTIKWWWLFKEDMLVLVHAGRNRLLDLGWTPEMDFDAGRYRLGLIEGTDHAGRELHAYETQDLEALVTEIERLLEAVTNGRL